MSEQQRFYTYILTCADGSLYTGWTTDMERRLIAHNLGKGARYTRARLPVSIAGYWEFGSKSEAMRFEWDIKQMTRAQKMALLIRSNALQIREPNDRSLFRQ